MINTSIYTIPTTSEKILVTGTEGYSFEAKVLEEGRDDDFLPHISLYL